MTTSIMWFRRDLRLLDNPALASAATAAGRVLPVFIRDPRLMSSKSPAAQRLEASLVALRDDTGGALVIRSGDPVEVIPEIAAEAGAYEVHVSVETTPYGRTRDDAVSKTLADVGARLVATGSPYAVTPGSVRNIAGAPYRVFTPFNQAWRDYGWPQPIHEVTPIWQTEMWSEATKTSGYTGQAGESAARELWTDFLSAGLPIYDEGRDRPDLNATSRMSIPLKYGEIHPRTLLADLAQRRTTQNHEAIDRFISELSWREFYADVLWNDSGSAWRDWRDRMRSMRYETDPKLVDAWREGRTGFPFVDAGMRQLRAEGWMHNRLRMVAASFLVKDLHVWWPTGARHFLDHLLDGDIASNNHGWQWVAGTGTDAAPYFRIFNPVTQGLRFDPDGYYVLRWVPELRHLTGSSAHEPWRHARGYADGYPEPIINHAVERREALCRLAETKRDPP